MFKPNYLVIILLCIASSIFAQGDFRKGFIINLANDTIPGYIDLTNANISSKICYFKNDTSNKNIESYSPEQINGYGFYQSKLYLSRTIKEKFIKPKHFFLEVLVWGKVNLFFLRLGSIDYFYIEKDGIIKLLSDKEEKIIINGNSYLRNNHEYKAVLKSVVHDADGFKEKTESINFKQKDIIKLVKDYHYATCNPGEPCIEYYKRGRTGTTSKWTRSFGVMAGGIISELTLTSDISNGLSYANTKTNASFQEKAYGFTIPGFYINFNRNGRLSFQASIDYSKIKSSNLTINDIGFSQSIELDLMKNKRFVPYITLALKLSYLKIIDSKENDYYLSYIEYTIQDPFYFDEELTGVIPENNNSLTIGFGFGTKINLGNGKILKIEFLRASDYTSTEADIGPYKGSSLKITNNSLRIYYPLAIF